MKDLLTKKDLGKILGSLENGVDKFMVAGFFYGLNGASDYKEQLLNLTKESVDFTNSTITLPDGRTVVMDETLKKITEEAINQSVYVKMGEQGRTNEDYLLNTDSPYIIKVKPTVLNQKGMLPMGVGGVKRKMSSMSDFLGVKITPSILKQSGAFNTLKEQGKKMTIKEAENLLKSSGLSIKRNTLVLMLKNL